MSKILAVDDDPQILGLIEVTLGAAGHEVLIVTNADQALELTEREALDLAILDVMLAGMSGLELAKRLREDPSTCDLPILMLSALSQPSDRIEGLRAGAADYLCKPFVPEELVLRVNRVLTTSPRSSSVLQGRLEFVPLPSVMQNLLQGEFTGVLEILTEEDKGEMSLYEGRVVAATLGDRSGRDAVLQMLDFETGSFRFRLADRNVSEAAEPAREISVQDLIFTAAWLVDELARRPTIHPSEVLWPAESDGGPPNVADGFEVLPTFSVYSEILHNPGTSLADLESRMGAAPGMVRLSVALLIESGAVHKASPLVKNVEITTKGDSDADLEQSVLSLVAAARSSGRTEGMLHFLLAVEPGVHEHLLQFRMEIPSRILAAPGGSLAAAWHTGRAASLALRAGTETVVVHVVSMDRQAACASVIERAGDFAAAVIWADEARLVAPIRTIADAVESSGESAWGLLISDDPEAGPRTAALLKGRSRWHVHLRQPRNLGEVIALLASAHRTPREESTDRTSQHELNVARAG